MSTGNPHHEDEFLAFVDDAVSEVTRREPEIDEESMRLVLLLHRVTNSVVYDLESTVHRAHGWSWAGFRLLFVLWVLGPLDSTTAAAKSGMSRPAITSLVRTLERDGLTARLSDPNDRRSVVIALTSEGREKFSEAYREHNAREQAWVDCLDADDRRALLAILEKLSRTARNPWVNTR